MEEKEEVRRWRNVEGLGVLQIKRIKDGWKKHNTRWRRRRRRKDEDGGNKQVIKEDDED